MRQRHNSLPARFGLKDLSPSLPTYGSRGGFISTSHGAPSGRLCLRSDLALQFSLLHGSIRDWTRDPSMKCRLYKVPSEALPRSASVL